MPFELRSLVEDVIGHAAVTARHKDLELALRISPKLPTQVIGDPSLGRPLLILLTTVGRPPSEALVHSADLGGHATKPIQAEPLHTVLTTSWAAHPDDVHGLVALLPPR